MGRSDKKTCLGVSERAGREKPMVELGFRCFLSLVFFAWGR